MKLLLVIPFIVFFGFGCGPSQSEYQNLLEENNSLKRKITNLEDNFSKSKKYLDEVFGGLDYENLTSNSLKKNAISAYQKGNFSDSRRKFSLLLLKFPYSDEYRLSLNYINDLDKKVKEGEALHYEIISKYTKLNSKYYEPFISGALTKSPVSLISIPESEWGKLTKEKKHLLLFYSSSLVNKVKNKPFKYTGVNSDAPLSHKVSANVESMTNEDWGIDVGVFTNSGMDLSSGNIIRSKDFFPVENNQDVNHELIF